MHLFGFAIRIYHNYCNQFLQYDIS